MRGAGKGGGDTKQRGSDMEAAMAQVADQTAPATGRRIWTESNARRATVLIGGRAVADAADVHG